MNTLQSLQWRYATKQFDPTRKLSAEQLQQLIDALILTPSSFGLQPWKFVIIEDQSLKEELMGHSWGQPQIAACSHLIVLCRRDGMDEVYVDANLAVTAARREIDEESLTTYKEMIMGFLGSRTPEQIAEWMSRQVYIALGNLMTTAATLEIDACPIEGFTPAEYDRVLDLEKEGLRSVLVCPVGYRSTDDKYADGKKIRFTEQELIVRK